MQYWTDKALFFHSRQVCPFGPFCQKLKCLTWWSEAKIQVYSPAEAASSSLEKAWIWICRLWNLFEKTSIVLDSSLSGLCTSIFLEIFEFLHSRPTLSDSKFLHVLYYSSTRTTKICSLQLPKNLLGGLVIFAGPRLGGDCEASEAGRRRSLPWFASLDTKNGLRRVEKRLQDCPRPRRCSSKVQNPTLSSKEVWRRSFLAWKFLDVFLCARASAPFGDLSSTHLSINSD